MPDKAQEARLTRYLLGMGAPAEREILESEYVADEEVFEQMLVAEEELIDAYVHGELSSNERSGFENGLLKSPDVRERMQFARLLAGVSNIEPAETIRPVKSNGLHPGFFATLLARPSVRYSLAAATLILAVTSIWLLVERTKMRHELQGLQVEREKLATTIERLQKNADAERKRSDQLAVQLEAEKKADETKSGSAPQTEDVAARNQVTERRGSGPSRKRRPTTETSTAANTSSPELITPRPPQGSVSFDLSARTVRSGGGIELRVPRNATFVGLRPTLDVDLESGTFRAFIETAAGNAVWHSDAIKLPRSVKAGERIQLPFVPAKQLPRDDYVLYVEGQRPDGSFEKIAAYSFRVLKN